MNEIQFSREKTEITNFKMLIIIKRNAYEVNTPYANFADAKPQQRN
jgi:hypothetical protein